MHKTQFNFAVKLEALCLQEQPLKVDKNLDCTTLPSESENTAMESSAQYLTVQPTVSEFLIKKKLKRRS